MVLRNCWWHWSWSLIYNVLTLSFSTFSPSCFLLDRPSFLFSFFPSNSLLSSFRSSVRLSATCLSVCLSVRLTDCLSLLPFVCLFVCLSPACLSVCLSVCFSVYLYVYLSVFRILSVCKGTGRLACHPIGKKWFWFPTTISGHLRYVLAGNLFSIFYFSWTFFILNFVSPEDCVDNMSPYRCIFLKTLEMCSSPGLQAFMISDCPKTCNFCGKSSISNGFSFTFKYIYL